MVEILEFFLQYKYIIIFYLIVILLLVINRKKIDVQAKIIFLYRMKWGLKWMDHVSSKWREWIILLGYVGVGAGYVGLVIISYVLVKNLVDLIMKPAAVSGVSLVLPGIEVPGLGVLPFWYWILGIFVIALIHEFSHGVVARAHNVEVKNTGLVLFGPILGAFVEPNEKKMSKEKDIVQYSILAAGSFSNILLGILAILLVNFAFAPLSDGMSTQTGFTFDNYFEGDHPFQNANIAPGTLITGINGIETTNFQQFSSELQFFRPGEKIVVNTAQKDYDITLGTSPEGDRGFLGVASVRNEFEVKEQYLTGIGKIWYAIIEWVTGFFRWLFLLSIGIGLFNLLPLPIVDGGRMTQVFLRKWKGQEKGDRYYMKIGMFFLLILLLNLFYPLLAKLF